MSDDDDLSTDLATGPATGPVPTVPNRAASAASRARRIGGRPSAGRAAPAGGASAADAATTDAVTTDAATTDAATTDAATSDAASADAATTDAATSDAASADAATTDAATADAATTDAVTTDAATADAVTTDAVTTDAATADAAVGSPSAPPSAAPPSVAPARTETAATAATPTTGTGTATATATATSARDARPRLPVWPAWALAGLLAAGAIVMAIVLALSGSSSAKPDLRVRDQVLAAAKTCVATLNEYRYTALAASERAALACTTGGFTTQFRKAFDGLIATQAPKLKSTQTAQINKAGVEAVTDGQWSVLIYGQLTVTNVNQKTGRTDPFAAVVRMEKKHGAWLVVDEEPVSTS